MMENKILKKVFLGGTCNGSKWRDVLIPHLTIDYFNPVVEDWSPEDQAREREERETCGYLLYVLTSRMAGVYSIAEVVEDSIKRPERTILSIVEEKSQPFSPEMKKSLLAVADMVRRNGAQVVAFSDLPERLK